MSSDAKAWYDDDGRNWKALHDGPCRGDAVTHDHGGHLSEVLEEVEGCMGMLRWVIRVYPDGTSGLVGYQA